MMLLEMISGPQDRRWSGFQAVLTLQTMAVAVPALFAFLVWQYPHRRTQSARVAFGAAAMVLLSLYALTPLSAEHSLFASAVPLGIRFAPEAAPASRLHRDGFALPLDIRGLPQDHRLWTDQAEVRFTASAGSETLVPNGYLRPSVVQHENAWHLFVPPGDAGVDPWLNGPGQLTASLFLTVVEPTQASTVPLRPGIVTFHGQRCRVGEELRFSTIHCSVPAESAELLWTTRDAETGTVLDSNRLNSPSRTYGFFLELLLAPLEFRSGASVRRDEPSLLDVKKSIVKSHFRVDLKMEAIDLRRYLSKQ